MKRIILILILLMNIAFAMQEELHTYLDKHLNNTSIPNNRMSFDDFLKSVDERNQKGLDYITANTSDPIATNEDVSNVNFIGKVNALFNANNIAYSAINKKESFKQPVEQEFKDKHYELEWNSKAETRYINSRVDDGLGNYLLDNPAESWEDLAKKERYYKELKRDKAIVEEKDLIANIILGIPIILFDIDILLLLIFFYFFRKDIINSIKKYPLSSVFLATIYPVIKISLLNTTLVPNTNVLIISGIISFIIFLNIIYSLNRNKYRLLGFYTSLESMFSSSIDKRIEYSNEKMLEILDSTTKSHILFYSKDLDIKQKQLIKLMIKGCFTVIDTIYTSSSGGIINLNTINKNSEKYSNYFLYYYLKWDVNEIIKINKILRNLEILQSQIHLDFNILGSNIAGNLYSNDDISKYLGYDNLSKENGVRLLEEFIETLENNKFN